jgi:hypothetical protein
MGCGLAMTELTVTHGSSVKLIVCNEMRFVVLAKGVSVGNQNVVWG